MCVCVCVQDRAWVNVAKSLNCITDMIDRLQGRQRHSQELKESTGDSQSQNTGGTLFHVSDVAMT